MKTIEFIEELIALQNKLDELKNEYVVALERVGKKLGKDPAAIQAVVAAVKKRKRQNLCDKSVQIVELCDDLRAEETAAV